MILILKYMILVKNLESLLGLTEFYIKVKVASLNTTTDVK